MSTEYFTTKSYGCTNPILTFDLSRKVRTQTRKLFKSDFFFAGREGTQAVFVTRGKIVVACLRLRKLAAHDPSLQQEYGHGVLAVRDGRPAASTHNDLVRRIMHQYEEQMQRLINQGRRWPRVANPTERPRHKTHTTAPKLDVGTTSQKLGRGSARRISSLKSEASDRDAK